MHGIKRSFALASSCAVLLSVAACKDSSSRCATGTSIECACVQGGIDRGDVPLSRDGECRRCEMATKGTLAPSSASRNGDDGNSGTPQSIPGGPQGHSGPGQPRDAAPGGPRPARVHGIAPRLALGRANHLRGQPRSARVRSLRRRNSRTNLFAVLSKLSAQGVANG